MTTSSRFLGHFAARSFMLARGSALLMVLATSACSGDSATAQSKPADPFAPNPPAGEKVVKWETTKMTIKGKEHTVEVAQSEEQIMRGLMFREKMRDDHGMLFCMPTLAVTNFWMKNTLIPLDIIFLDENMKVLQVDHRRPLDETGSGPTTPTLYVIELNLGMADKLGLKVGDVVEIPKQYVRKPATAPATQPK